MKDANCSVTETEKFPNYALPHDFINDEVSKIPFHQIDAIGPAGSINAHIEDYAKWLLMNVNMGKYNEKQIISEEGLGEIFAPQMSIDKDNDLVKGINRNKEFSDLVYTLGWVSQHFRGYQMLQHAGGIDGFSAFISVMPEDDLGVAILTNLNGTAIHYGITWEITDRMLGLEPIEWVARVAEYEAEVKAEIKAGTEGMLSMQVKDTQPSHKMEDYCGTYSHPGYGTLTLKLEDGELCGQYNHISANASHFHYDTFLLKFDIPSPDVTIPITFQADLMGNIKLVSIPMDEKVAEIEFIKEIEEEA